MSSQPETPKAWARRVLAEHGPPPPHVLSRVRAIRTRATKHAANPMPPGDAA
ncbi:hypothetical protein [Phycicoccus avicenniae]|uniref:hypothetical protein n=1 Tax=Phycicoccus avicenniae TaxID=2828860 RepID=UPI003D2E1B1E